MITQSALQGHWQRAWITAPGFRDETTRVHWLQAGTDFIDIRVPADLPDLSGAGRLCDLSCDKLLSLMRAEGFAGQITIDAGNCTWNRDINWHGRPLAADVGAMSWDENGDLIEDGVHADYRELWRHADTGPFRFLRFARQDQSGYLADSGRTFCIGIGTPDALPTEELKASLANGIADPARLRAQFAGEFTMGRWQGSVGIATLSSNPLQIGQPVLQSAPEGLTFQPGGFDRRPEPIVLNLP